MFRTGGIYVLPNGREVMASGDGSSFYAVADGGEAVLRYELNEAGRLLLDGRLTAWDAKDLRDSERTAEIPSTLQRSQSADLVVNERRV
jgi:hypothetical protein